MCYVHVCFYCNIWYACMQFDKLLTNSLLLESFSFHHSVWLSKQNRVKWPRVALKALSKLTHTHYWLWVSCVARLCNLFPSELWFTEVAITTCDSLDKNKHSFISCCITMFFCVALYTPAHASLNIMLTLTCNNPLANQQASLLHFRFEWPISQMCLFSV